jgi:hypothetical protein
MSLPGRAALLTGLLLATAADLRADLALSPELMIRAGATLAQRSAFGVGVAYRTQRRIVVR